MVKNFISYEDDFELRHQFNNIFYAIRQEFLLVNAFADTRLVLSHLDKYKPDIVMMDIQMLDEDDGLVALYQIKQHDSAVKVMMLTMFDNDDKVFNAICLGADGFMLKSDFSAATMPHEVLRKSLRVLLEGGAYLTPAIARKILRLFTEEGIADKINRVKTRFKNLIIQLTNPKKMEIKYKLTKMQLIVLEKIVEGNTTAEIAEILHISENTVNTHIKSIYHVLEVHSRAKAIRKAVEERLVKYKS